MTDQAKEETPATVSERTQQAGEAQNPWEIRARWGWVEPEVWTERMLTALEEGVKGGKWFRLIDKVYALPNLRKAFARVKANSNAAGVDHVTVEEFERHLEANLEELSQSLQGGSYRPQAIRRAWIPKLGSKEMRPLGIPTVRDRVVQAALRAVLEPIFERDFAAQSYGFRPKRGCKDALRRVDTLLKQGYNWVVDADLKSYFDTIPHSALLDRVGEKVADGRVLRLLEAFLHARVMETAKGWTPEGGTPQGAVVSPLLSNIYLDPLDPLMAGKGIEMVRYADDFVVLCRTEVAAQEALEVVRGWTTMMGLTLHPVKTRIVDATPSGGFDFLGYHFERGGRWPRKKSLDKFKDTIRIKTRRHNGQSLQAILTDLNRTLRGWFEYFKHSPRFTFIALDQWVRLRLRSLLRFRQGRKGTRSGFGSSTLAQCFLCQAGTLLLNGGPCLGLSILSEVRPPTGEPDAGELPVRFGGRGSGQSCSPYPYPGLVLPFVTTLTYAISSVAGVEPLTRPHSSGTLSREGRGLWLEAR
ncbi:MAG TPA: group II intron reverse transcriptase/maturase, partial [Candidatus Methylomirabilis sp.]|nr:group II intron reverse transcriptase/maturase [Candidatus Methylomirabilis sp.]